MISRYILEIQPYNDAYSDVTWENSSLRRWLNDTFYNKAFTSSEKNMICESYILNSNNEKKGTAGGADTYDKLFCLSVDEVRTYYVFNTWDDDFGDGYCSDLIAEGTQYLNENEKDFFATIRQESFDDRLNEKGYSDSVVGIRSGRWWLRTPGNMGSLVCGVGYEGDSGWTGLNLAGAPMGVRPALFISK